MSQANTALLLGETNNRKVSEQRVQMPPVYANLTKQRLDEQKCVLLNKQYKMG